MKKGVAVFLMWSGCLAFVAGFAMLGLGTPDLPQSQKDSAISWAMHRTASLMPIGLLLYAGLALLPGYRQLRREQAEITAAKRLAVEDKIRDITGTPNTLRE